MYIYIDYTYMQYAVYRIPIHEHTSQDLLQSEISTAVTLLLKPETPMYHDVLREYRRLLF